LHYSFKPYFRTTILIYSKTHLLASKTFLKNNFYLCENIKKMKLSLLFLSLLLSWNIFAQNKVLSKEEVEFELEFMEATKHYLKEEYPKAIEILKKCLKLQSKNDVCLHLLANSYLKLDKFSEAIPFAQKAYELQKNNLHYAVLLSELYKDTDSFDKASTILGEYIEKNAVPWEYYIRLSALYRVLSQNQKALAVFDLAEKRNGYSEQIGATRYKIMQEAGFKADASKELDKLLRFFEYEVGYYELKANLLLEEIQDKPTEAQLKTEAKQFIDKNLAQFEEYPDLHFKKCQLLFLIGQPKEALQAAQKAFSLHATLEEQKIDFLEELAQMPVLSEKFDENFVQILQLFLKEYPANAQIQRLLADYLVKFSVFEQVPPVVLSILRFDGSRYEDWYNLLNSEEKTKAYDSLAKHAEKALELFPNDAQIWHFQGKAFLAKKALEDSEIALEQANRLLDFMKNKNENINEQQSKILTSLVELCSLQNNTPKMENYLNKATQIAPNANSWEAIGDVCFRIGKTDLALNYWQKAKNLGSKSSFLDKKILEKKLVE